MVQVGIDSSFFFCFVALFLEKQKKDIDIHSTMVRPSCCYYNIFDDHCCTAPLFSERPCVPAVYGYNELCVMRVWGGMSGLEMGRQREEV